MNFVLDIKKIYFMFAVTIQSDGEGIWTSDEIFILFCYTVYWFHTVWMGCFRSISYEGKTVCYSSSLARDIDPATSILSAG